LASVVVFGQARDPAPYAPIGNPLPISGVDQKVRDSLTLKPSRVRVNQAGYRVVEVKASMAKFYYVGVGSTFQVIDSATRIVVGGANLSSKGFNSATKFGVKASTWAGRVAGGDTRYTMSTDGLRSSIASSPVMEGTLPTTLLEGGKYRVVVGADTSATFFVSDSLYGMVRDGILKFFGIQRSGDGPSWFHPPSHTKDGAMDVPSAPGVYKGGWYDCGDHLKEPITMSFALATLATLNATISSRDADKYGINHANVNVRDGIPDVLAEARFGAEFFLRSWVLNKRKTAGMVTGIGDFGDDHGWWGRPENQDAMTEDGRGGWKERKINRIMGTGSIANQATGLALLSRKYRIYDAKWADTALLAAKDMYAYAKGNIQSYTGIAPYSQGIDKAKANLALAAIALLWATKDPAYLKDLAYDRAIGPQGSDAFFPNSVFDGGWLAAENKFFDMSRGTANFDFANIHPMVLYAFHKLILSNADSAKAFGVTSEAERILLGRRTINAMIGCLVAVSGNGASIALPGPDDGVGATRTMNYDPNWFKMYTQQEWVWNRYYIANAAELFFYHDMASDFANGRFGTNMTGKDWKLADIRQLLIRQLDFQLGVNPWDVSMIMGLGEKNFNHPHHRAANPEGRNTPGAAYGYQVPVGALYGGYDPSTTTAAGMVDTWGDYHHTEVCTDGAAVSLAAVMGLAAEEPVRPPNVTVNVVYVSDTLAHIKVHLDKFGTMKLDYGLNAGSLTNAVAGNTPGVDFEFKIGGLKPGTQYFFDVVATDLMGNSATYTKWSNPLPAGTPYSFTTELVAPGRADIQNVKVCNVTSDSAEIMWFTPDGKHQSSICYGKTPTQDATWTCLENVDQAGHPTKFHYVKIGDLQEQTDYWFKVGSDGTWDDNNGSYYRFRTPVKMARFSIYTVKYTVGGMPAIAINIGNDEARTYDSLTLRVYVRSKDTVSMTGHLWGQALKDVPVRFGDAVQARYDICQAYNGAGFNLPCSDSTWGKHPVTGGAWDWGKMGAAVQMLQPVKMPETFDPKDSTYAYYFNLPLGPTDMVQQSRIRFDVIFGDKSVYSKAPSADQRTMLTWIRAFTPDDGGFPDTGWFDQGPVGPEKWHTWGNKTKDWSFIPHSVAAGDPVDFPGMMEVLDQAAADELIDGMSTEVVLNPYVTVYRKGEFVYGFSPSYIEQAQKKTYWDINVDLKAPFDLPNGSNITLDQASSTVRFRGSADIFDKLTPAAKGVITDIWVNGVRLTDTQKAAAAVWNPTTKLWDLDIPAKMAIGGQALDITIFGGSAQCPDTATSCSSGCAFYNANYFVQFTRGPITKSVMTLLAPTATTYPVKTAPDSLALTIRIADKDQTKKGALGATVLVTVSNPLRAYSKTFTLTETSDTGVFLSGAISLTAKTTGLLPTEVPFLRGDSIWFKYHDAADEDDSAVAFVYSEATWPLPVKAGLFRTCDGTLLIRAAFDKPFSATVPWADAEVVALNAAGDSVGVVVVPAAQIVKGTSNDIALAMTETVFGSWQRARLTLPVADGRGGWVSNAVSVSDSIGPWVDSAKIVENVLGTAQDTAYVWTSEKVKSISVGSFVVSRGGVSSPVAGVDSVRASDASGRAWTVFLKSGAFKAGDSLRLLSTSTVTDMAGNSPSDCPTMGRNVSLIGRAAPFAKAWVLDSDGDGFADQVKMVYRKVVAASDLPDSIEVTFGDVATVRTAAVSGLQVIDSTVTVALPIPFGWGQTKGVAPDGSGTIALWKGGTRSSASSLSDSVGPVLVASALRFARLGDQDTLVLSFSEPVGPSVGTSWLTHQTGADLGALPPISVSSTSWHYPIPASTVFAGDSVKPLATSRWVDLASGRHAPLGHPWIAVVGGERAPLFGWYSDEDGDAAVDHVHIQFVKSAPKTRPSFNISLPGVSKIVIDSGTWTLDASGMGATISVGPLAKNVTTFGNASNGTWKSMGIETAFPIYDSVAPVLVSATLRYASGDSIPDTLKVRWSESLQGVTTLSPVVHGSRIDRKAIVGFSTPDADGLGATILVWADLMGFTRGDSAQLDGVASAIRDMDGNVPGPNIGWVQIKFGNRPIRLVFTINNMLVTPNVPVQHAGPSLALQVRARPEKGLDTSWQRLDGFAPLDESEIVSLTFTINRAMTGSAHIFDNSGSFVTAINLEQISQMDAAGILPKDGSGMFQVKLAWEGSDQNGKPVAGGVYYMRLVLKDGGGDTGEPVRIVNNVYSFGIKRSK
jgi:hypothetical protein